jgi:hypothetical protein
LKDTRDGLWIQKIPACWRGFSVKSVVHVKLEKEEVEGAGSFYFLERPEGDEVVTDAYDFHGDDYF